MIVEQEEKHPPSYRVQIGRLRFQALRRQLDVLDLAQQIVQRLQLLVELGQQQARVLLRHGRLVLFDRMAAERAVELAGGHVDQLVGLQVGERFAAARTQETGSAGCVALFGFHALPHQIQLVFDHVHERFVVDVIVVDFGRLAVGSRFHFEPDMQEFVHAQHRDACPDLLLLEAQQLTDVVLFHARIPHQHVDDQ